MVHVQPEIDPSGWARGVISNKPLRFGECYLLCGIDILAIANSYIKLHAL